MVRRITNKILGVKEKKIVRFNIAKVIVASDLLNLFCRLDTGYIDLYLIHSPRPGGNVDSYKAMLKLQEEGVLR